MTQNQRILLNVVATYGRSVYSMACGIFTSRWVLMGLGQVDYGLYGVVGGLTAFIAFFNSLLAGAISRFYAVSVGRAQVSQSQETGLEECRRWFSIATFIHTVIPMVLILVGYPLGVWAIRHWLTIPSAKILDCVWVFRFVCLSCFVGMVNIPFTAMYTAKQYIAELTVYSFATTTVNVMFLFYMVEHPGEWLVRYAFWMSLLSILPQLIIMLRAFVVFPECRFRLHYCLDWSRIRNVLSYAGWHMFGCFGTLLRGQGIAILVNKCFGPRINASMSVANTVNSQASNLAAAMVGAFSPAIITAYGAGKMEYMRTMAFRACKFGMVLTLLFSLPLAVELDYIVELWLKTPPPYVVGLCLCMMTMLVIDKSAVGHMIALNASGRIAGYQVTLGTVVIATLPLAWLLVHFGFGVYSIGWAMVITMMGAAWGRVIFARRIVGMSIRKWLTGVMLPSALSATITVLVGLVPRLFMPAGLSRVALSTTLCVFVYLPFVWFLGFDANERLYCREFVLRHVRGRLCHAN